MRFSFIVAILLAVTGCAPGPTGGSGSNGAATPVALPTMNLFSGAHIEPVRRSNSSIANDFMALAFQLESGRRLPVFSRFEGPITVRVTGFTSPSLSTDLTRLLTRLRSEAGIDITQVPARQKANITIQVVSARNLQRVVPNAACFVAPRVSGWDEFKRNRRSGAGDWTTLVTRETMSIFLPGDVSPQEIRDCLHEELAQTLGPVNDMFHLTDSVFNDDNVHTVLTGFDMLVLRMFYAPELRSGMSPEAVGATLPAILARLRPGGGAVGTVIPTRIHKDWHDAVLAALGGAGTTSARRIAAQRAVAIARSHDWNDNRLAFSLFALGRLSLATDGSLALSSFLQASEIYQSRPETRLHAANVSVQLAAYALTSGNPQHTVDLVNQHFSAALDAQNAGLLATLLMLKAQAYDVLGREEEAKIIRLDSLGWARYGFGSDQEIRRRLSEISALPPNREG